VLAALVVVGTCAGGCGEQGEGPQVSGLAETFVADDAAGDVAAFAGGAGDRRGVGVGLEAFGIVEAGPVVSDLGEYPGAEDGAEPWEAGDGLGVRVLVKRLGECLLEVGDAGNGGVEGPLVAKACRLMAASTRGSWRSCSLRSPERILLVSVCRLRRRPARARAARRVVLRRPAAAAGAGARARVARASREARSGKVARKEG